jgi:hypothetical protein
MKIRVGKELQMPELLSEQEFTERFTEAIKGYELSPRCKEPLLVELCYGEGEPTLTLSLKDAFNQYQAEPDKLEELMRPFVEDLGWTVQPPRYPSKELYELTLPTLRNFYSKAPTDSELSNDPSCPKGPIVFEQVLKAPTEFLILQFHIFKDDQYVPLRKGDILPCMPDPSTIIRLSLNNLAIKTEVAGLTATPLQFENLKARSWLIGLGDDRFSHSIAALTCISQAMKSLEETFKGENGLIAIIPSADQLIVSIDTDEQSVAELGVLARQLAAQATAFLSTFVWTFKDGNLEAVQSLDLQEITKAEPELS